MKIVNAEEKHIPAIRDIYAHHVLHGTGSFETDPPDAHEMLARLEKIRSLGLPWVVALQEDKVIGYCYLTRYRERYAYRYTLEDSIYIAPTAQRQGVGKALLRHVIGWAEAQGYRQLIAIVGDSNNQGSLKVHQQAGFTQIGTLKNIGFKHGLWLDTVLLQRNLGEGNGTLPPDSGVAIKRF
ncbi:GNAT family N-acetyltransferase [Citrobacter sp. Colony322]|nr:GNAT family N-acetyltransferase [Citrobacter sp. Colony322]